MLVHLECLVNCNLFLKGITKFFAAHVFSLSRLSGVTLLSHTTQLWFVPTFFLLPRCIRSTFCMQQFVTYCEWLTFNNVARSVGWPRWCQWQQHLSSNMIAFRQSTEERGGGGRFPFIHDLAWFAQTYAWWKKASCQSEGHNTMENLSKHNYPADDFGYR